MKTSFSHFLWPKVKFNLYNIFGVYQYEHIEKKFNQMFPSGYPVLCSSGRVALYIAINEYNLARENRINLFPYASHCVINSIARLTSPVPYTENDKTDIIYHQWGITHEVNHVPLIEDSVDSLYELNTPLFCQGANFEIWSLPKILGTSSGGILWCKKESDAERIRKRMNHTKGITFSWLLRIMSYKYSLFYNLWEGTEKGYKGVSRIQRNEIYFKINSWCQLVKNRKEKLRLFKKYSILKDKEFKGRLPSCLPIKSKLNKEQLSVLGLATDKRHFLHNNNLIKVLPLPIHQDVDISFLKKIINTNENGR